MIDAIYENGVIKPLDNVDLKEHQKITISIHPKPKRKGFKYPAERLIGLFKSGKTDLSIAHDKYLYGMKKASR